MKKIISLGILAAFMGGAYAAQNNFYVGLGGSADFLKTKTTSTKNEKMGSKNKTAGSLELFAGWNCDTCSKIDFGLELRGGVPFGKIKYDNVYAKANVAITDLDALKAAEETAAYISDTAVTAAIKDSAAAWGAAQEPVVDALTWDGATADQRAAVVTAYATGFATRTGATPTITLSNGAEAIADNLADAAGQNANFKITGLKFAEDQIMSASVKRKPFGMLLAHTSVKLSDLVSFYIAGGMKFWKVKTTGNYKVFGTDATKTKNKTELTPVVGAGFQVNLKNNWFARAEYMHDLKENINNAPAKAKLIGIKKIKMHGHSARLALGYKF